VLTLPAFELGVNKKKKKTKQNKQTKKPHTHNHTPQKHPQHTNPF